MTFVNVREENATFGVALSPQQQFWSAATRLIAAVKSCEVSFTRGSLVIDGGPELREEILLSMIPPLVAQCPLGFFCNILSLWLPTITTPTEDQLLQLYLPASLQLVPVTIPIRLPIPSSSTAADELAHDSAAAAADIGEGGGGGGLLCGTLHGLAPSSWAPHLALGLTLIESTSAASAPRPLAIPTLQLHGCNNLAVACRETGLLLVCATEGGLSHLWLSPPLSLGGRGGGGGNSNSGVWEVGYVAREALDIWAENIPLSPEAAVPYGLKAAAMGKKSESRPYYARILAMCSMLGLGSEDGVDIAGVM
jgi:hypothetical protein